MRVRLVDVEYFSKTLLDKAAKFALVGRLPNPAVSEALGLLETLELFVRTLTILVLTIPESRGKLFRDDVKSVCTDLIKGIASLINPSLEEPLDTQMHPEHLFANHNAIFDVCERMKNLSYNNSMAIQKRWDDSMELLQDVINEMEELQNDDGMFDFDDSAFEKEGSPLTDDDKAMVKRCLAIVKLTKILFKKLLVRCIKDCQPNTEEKVSWLDQLYETSKKVLEKVDDLGVSLHETCNIQIICLHAAELTDVCAKIIDVAKLLTSEEHLSWFEKCGDQYHRVLVSILERSPQR
ncbi:hypothetical protein O9G_002929 [Rozella allomycis CSF55]|uniref:Uncharacterized protein n=1 Tax=Rozella allomycis (strain CSF55) TaxID=988480 RepID=A0A075ANJ8_ROZAC|nr:hypothetical protein O9G_002929 [Rozella allomycis CSF55]|eukprot:EPZ31460.1 hypothetical protein O9G_002929 [Rozella allomycis CSF55]